MRDLPLGELEGVGDLDAALAGEVLVVVELLLQLEDLGPGVRRPQPLPVCTCQPACLESQSLSPYTLLPLPSLWLVTVTMLMEFQV